MRGWELEREGAHLDLIATEDPKDTVLEREEEVGGARVALTAGAAAQLIIDAPRVMEVGPDDVQSTKRHHLLTLWLKHRLECLAHSLVRLAR